MARMLPNTLNRRVSVAPMMEWTDRHDRYFLRLISKYVLLYTEMVAGSAVVYGDRERLISYNAEEHPVALQLGGSEPSILAEAARIATDYGYDEINLNVGCPSDKVQSGRFGACLMRDPDLVARCVEAMAATTHVPVTVKCRIGVDEQEPLEVLPVFLEKMIGVGCPSVTIHARKAWLRGLSPKENRIVPPLDYDLVYQMKRAYPQLEMIINGGISSLEETQSHLETVDGVMMGRVAYEQPYLLVDVDHRFFGAPARVLTRAQILEKFLPYVERKLMQRVPLNAMTRHILGLYHGVRGARNWRRHLSENAVRPGAGLRTIQDAMSYVEEHSVLAELGI